MQAYYTLFVYEKHTQMHGQWVNYFGDYDKDVVQDEADDLHFGWNSIQRKNMRIVKTSDQQTDIDAALDKLNGKVGLS